FRVLTVTFLMPDGDALRLIRPTKNRNFDKLDNPCKPAMLSAIRQWGSYICISLCYSQLSTVATKPSS
ncbi:hypothetical protein ACTJKU_26275, partial [Citrobacter freundii]